MICLLCVIIYIIGNFCLIGIKNQEIFMSFALHSYLNSHSRRIYKVTPIWHLTCPHYPNRSRYSLRRLYFLLLSYIFLCLLCLCLHSWSPTRLRTQCFLNAWSPVLHIRSMCLLRLKHAKCIICNHYFYVKIRFRSYFLYYQNEKIFTWLKL